MTLPILFKPGDILTAEQINNYLVNKSEEQLSAFRNEINPIIDEIESKLTSLEHKATLHKLIATGGKPRYDYESI